jgi:hypothetical protein
MRSRDHGDVQTHNDTLRDRAPHTARVMIALVFGLLASAYIAYAAAYVWPGPDAFSDIDHLWFAARDLWRGGNPYQSIGPHPGATYRFGWPMFYPLTTVVALLPLASLPVAAFRIVWVGIPAVLFAWRVTERSPWHWLWLLSFGVIDAAGIAQWSIFTTAVALTPSLAFLLVLKPQAALAWVLATLSPRLARDIAVAGLALLAISLCFDPAWVPKWLTAVSAGQHLRPLLVRPLAWPLLLALTRWRRLEARLIVALAIVPITPAPYELVPLVLVPRSRPQLAMLVACTWLAYAVQWTLVSAASPSDRLAIAQDVLLLLVYLPALAMVLRRPNEGDVPSWVERLRTRVVTWRTAPASRSA